MNKTNCTVNNWVIVPASGAIHHVVTGEERRLGTHPLRLLAVLQQHPGEILSHEALTAQVWEDRAVSSHSLPNAIHTLRTALADNGKQQRIIRTIPKQGYVLEAKYCRPLVSGPPPDPRSVTPEIDIPPQETPPAAPALPAQTRQQTPVAAQPFPYIKVLLIMLILIFSTLCSGYLALTYNNKIVAKEVAKNIYSHLRIFALLAPGERMKEPTAIYDRLKESYTRLNQQAKQKALRIAIYYRSQNQTLNYTFRIHTPCEQRVLVMQIDHWRSDTALLNKLIMSETRRKMDEMALCHRQ